MNTAVARRLALGDRVVWIGNDGPLGTITRITAHVVEVRWDGGTMARYRRTHLLSLRHVHLISDTVERGRMTPEPSTTSDCCSGVNVYRT